MNGPEPRNDRRGVRDEQGTAGVELVGMLPVLLLCLLVVLQFGVACWTLVQTQQAARGAARAASLGQDPYAAARGALPGTLRGASVVGGATPDGQRWTVRVEVPSLLHVHLATVTRTVEMPAIR